MKILILTPNLHCGGAERVLHLLSNEWAKCNEVIFCLFDSSDQFYSTSLKIIDLESRASNYKFYKIYNFFQRVFKFQNHIKKTNPDLIISFTESANYVSIASCALSGTRNNLIVSVRTNLKHFSYLTRTIVSLIYNFASKVVVPSVGSKNLLMQMGIKKSKLKVINNPVSYNLNENFFLMPSTKRKPYILAVGRLSAEKGFDRLIKSFADINENIELFFIGEGPEKESLMQLSILLGVEKKVKFLGFLKNLDKWYLGARFLVLTSFFEGWPNVIVEAMSFKCPVIAFDCEYGPSEIIQNNYNGILVNQHDTKILTKEMLKLLSDNNFHKKLSQNAYIRAKAFKVDEIAIKWLYLLENQKTS